MKNDSKKYPHKVEVTLTDKQYRYLEVLNLLKGKKGLSAVIRDIIDEYRRSNTI